MVKMVNLKNISRKSPARAAKKTFLTTLHITLILWYIKAVTIRPVTRSTLRKAQIDKTYTDLIGALG